MKKSEVVWNFILDYVFEEWRWTLVEIIKRCGTAQKMKFSFKDFFSKCDKIRRKLQFPCEFGKSLMKNFIFLQCGLLSIESFIPKI